MGLFGRLATLVRGVLHALLGRAERPEIVLDQLLRELRAQLARAQQQAALALAEERRLREEAERLAAEARLWEERAALAVRHGRDDLARVALARRQEAVARATELEGAWRAQAAENERLKEALRQLLGRLEDAERQRAVLVAKHRQLEARERAHRVLEELRGDAAVARFREIAARIEHRARVLDAQAALGQELRAESVEAAFAALETPDLEAELRALKARLGVAPTSLSGGTPRTEEDLLAEFRRLERQNPPPSLPQGE